MFSLNTRVDGFRFRFPKTFIEEALREKYGKILAKERGFFCDPVEFLNESVKNVDLLGLNNGTVEQRQGGRNLNVLVTSKKRLDLFAQMHTDISYRNPDNPLNLLDKTLVVKFRHTLGFINYFMLFENFWYQYSRDYDPNDLTDIFNIELIDTKGSIISKVVIEQPLMFGIENLSLDYARPVAENQEFTVTFKYNNIEYEFIGYE